MASADTVQLPSAATPDLSFVVLLTRESSITTPCLESIAAADLAGHSAEVVLVNACPDPESRNRLHSEAGAARRIDAPAGLNVGTAVGWNLAFAAARGDVVVVLQEDARIAGDFLTHGLAALANEPDAAVVGARHRNVAEVTTNLGTVVWRDGLVTRLTPANAPFLDESSEPYEVPVTSLAAAVVDRAAWVRVGGFDERLFPTTYNDVDFCMAIASAGRRALCAPLAEAIHVPGTASARHARELVDHELRRFLGGRNRERLAEKWEQNLSCRPERPPGVGCDDVPPETIEAALANDGGTSQLVKAARPITGADEPWPTGIDAGIERSLLQAQVELLTGFTAHLAEEELAPERRRLEEIVIEADAASADAKRRLEEAGVAYRELRERHAELERRVKEESAARDEVEAQLHHLLQSRTWRSGAPVRKLARYLRRAAG